MQSTTIPTLTHLLTSILIVATRMLRDTHRSVLANDSLKTIFAAQHANTHIGRAIRLATLLIRRIQIHGLLPFTPTRRNTATPAATPRPQTQPRLHTGNGDAAFVRRPIPVIIAAITRELLLAAQTMGAPLPESLQTLCRHATIASVGLDTDEAPTQASGPPPQPTPPQPTPTPQPNPETPTPQNQPNPPPTETLEL